jgi:hypothetical protein
MDSSKLEMQLIEIEEKNVDLVFSDSYILVRNNKLIQINECIP